MKYVGNYYDWVSPQLWDQLLNTNGDTVPVWQPNRWKGTPLLDEARLKMEPAYSHLNHNFQQFNKTTKGMEGLVNDLPIPLIRKFYSWWFIKLLPGQMQPMHFDPHVTEEVNVLRYTMFLTDYQPGHVFTYERGQLIEYKAGDMFLWDDPMSYHGVCNIGYENRLTMQITMHD